MSIARIGSAAVLGGLFLVIGCEQGEASASADAGASADSPASVDAPAQDPSAQASAESASCSAWADKLCDKAGETSPTCTSLREASTIMAEQACAAGLEHIDASISKLDEARKVCDELASKLCKDIGAETETCQMVQKQTATFPPSQCNDMMTQYDEVLGELEQMEARNKPLSDDLASAISAGDAPGFGPSDAAVTLVEFSDFQCPYCARAAETVEQIKKEYGDEVRFVFRQFPLSFHEQAHLAGQASLAAHAQGKFWEFHDLMFEHQSELDRDSLETYAEQAGLDMAKFKAALDEGTYKDEVDAELEMGKKVAVDGTPTLFINGERVPNPTDFASVSAQIDKAIAGAKAKG